MMSTPLRGELTPPAIPMIPMLKPDIEQNLESIQSILSRFTRLSCSPPAPQISIESENAEANEQIKAAEDATASWSWTASEAAEAEAALLPFLVHMSAAQDDTETLSFCLKTAANLESHQQWNAAGGLQNFPQPASGMTPLHIAAMSGSEMSVVVLIQAGALVHIRDALGHTPLYYVRITLLSSSDFFDRRVPGCTTRS
jgi:60kDa lysophospholipase